MYYKVVLVGGILISLFLTINYHYKEASWQMRLTSTVVSH